MGFLPAASLVVCNGCCNQFQIWQNCKGCDYFNRVERRSDSVAVCAAALFFPQSLSDAFVSVGVLLYVSVCWHTVVGLRTIARDFQDRSCADVVGSTTRTLICFLHGF